MAVVPSFLIQLYSTDWEVRIGGFSGCSGGNKTKVTFLVSFSVSMWTILKLSKVKVSLTDGTPSEHLTLQRVWTRNSASLWQPQHSL